MSKYTTNRHGIIGYDNVFFYHDVYREFHEFRSILWFNGLDLKGISSLNFLVESPVEQMVYDRITLHWPDTSDMLEVKGDAFAVHPNPTTHRVPRHNIRKWLDKHTPGWVHSPIRRGDDHCDNSFFFKKVKEARAFRDLLTKHLEGAPTVWTKKMENT